MELNKGSIAVGRDADIIVFDEQIKVSDVFVGGEKVI
jgi:N-acetylglucosamine-6-phosphate deacetylase